jgi:hypothetical protein
MVQIDRAAALESDRSGIALGGRLTLEIRCDTGLPWHPVGTSLQ